MPLVLVDLDDTLLDRKRSFERWSIAFAVDNNLPVSPTVAVLQDIDENGYRPRDAFVAAVNRAFGVWGDHAAAEAAFREDIVRYLPPLDIEVVRALSDVRLRGWRVAIVSNGDAAQQMAKIARSGLSELVDASVISGQVGLRKPDPRIFRLAAERCAVTLVGAWMIGDDVVADIGGAQAVGLRTVWIRHGRPWPPDVPPPTGAVDSVVEALSLVGRATASSSATNPG